MVKTDCFAYGNDGCDSYCCARNVMLCRHFKGVCPSFKPRDEYQAELMRINGTTNMQEIIAAYSAADPDKRRERWLAIVKRVKGETDGR